jgi:queuine/archaeosine tRNA-ribosyltransferase
VSKLVKRFARPVIWLGQSVDTSSICSQYPQLRKSHFLTSLGCAIRRPSLRRSHFNVSLRAKLGVTGPLMVDSGGFALLMNPTAKWSARNVSDLISRIDADVFVSLDLPPLKSDTAADHRKKIFRSHRNYQFLSMAFPDKVIMPVIHGRTVSELELSLDLLSRCSKRPAWVGLGGIVPLLQNRYVTREIAQTGPEVFIAQALTMIRRAFPKVKIHAFGAGGTRTFPAVVSFGADSGDSIGWRQAAGFGSIFLPLKSQRAVIWNGSKRAPRKLLDDSDLEQLQQCGCPFCIQSSSIADKIELLQRDFHSRAIHNAWTISNQYRYWPKTRSAMTKFIGEGYLGRPWMRAVQSTDV